MENSELEKVKAAIKKIWEASHARAPFKEDSEHVYELGVMSGLQGLAFALGWGVIAKWD